MLLDVTLLWLLLMVMRMWMFSKGKMPGFLSTTLEKNKKEIFLSSFVSTEECISYANGSSSYYYYYYFILKHTSEGPQFQFYNKLGSCVVENH